MTTLMPKRTLCLLLSICLVFAFCPATLAGASPYYASDVNAYELDDFENGDTCNLTVGGTLVVPAGYRLTFSKASVASYNEATHTITGLKAGTVTVAYTDAPDPEPGADADEDYDPDDYDSGSFTLTVYSYSSLQNKSYRVACKANDWGSIDASLTIKAKGISEDAGAVELLDDSIKSASGSTTPDAWLESADNDAIVLAFSRAGTHKVTLSVNGLRLTIKVQVVQLSLNKTSVVLCKGKTATLKVKNAQKVTFKSGNTLVAKVKKSGKTAKVTPRQLGNATITATADGLTFICAVAVTSKKAYKAVQNAKTDLKRKYVYSQPKRMKAGYRDCSSFVSRCYWDASLKRKIFAIGGASGKTWAFPAAEQAQWLNKKGKRVAYKAVSPDTVLPGDTLYFETDYAGKNSSYRHIDHAAIYLGGGLYLHTGGYGGKGTVGYGNYYAIDSSVKFIGRPISAFTLNHAQVTLKRGKSTTLKTICAKGKVKFKSSKTSIAKVSAKGKVTAKKKGTCTITAKCKAGNYRCKVVVK